MDFTEFKATVSRLFPDISSGQMEMFEALGPLYNDWNSKINVISRKDMDGLYLHHVLHSLAVALYLKDNLADEFLAWKEGGVSVLDLGTGGGFPGIPMAILFPAADFTLCDSIGKKITVASGVAGSLGLANVRTVNARAETLTEKYDYVISRAVTSLENFYPWVRGKYSRRILYLKGGDIVPEIARMMGQFRLPKGSVSTWPIEKALEDEWFKGKFVIDVAK